MMEKYQRLIKVLKFCFRLISDIDVAGVENVPQDGAFILATNHLSRLDTPLLGITCPRKVYAMVATKYQAYPFFRWLMDMADAIWVRRTEFDRDALVASLEVLKRGDVLGVAPEGTRSRTRTLQEGKPGVAFLAARLGILIVPVGIAGTERLWEDMGHLRRPHLQVVYGEPFRLPKEGKLTSEELQAATDLIMQRIAVLLPAEYRGVYAEAVAPA